MEAGEEAERLTEQMPAEICVYRGLVYFINASDRQTLYCVETDGKNLTKLGDFPMQNMIIIGDCIYFFFVCDSENSLFDPLLKEEAKGDQYLYSVSLDGSDCRCLVADRCKEFNRVMQGVEQLALKDREDFFQEVQEVKEAGYEDCGNWFKTYGYSNLYVGERYISFYCYIRTYDGGIRPWEEAIPLTFNRETGEYLTMDELFTVNRNAYMKRLSSAVYKYAELSGEEYFWNEGFDQNVLVKEFKPYCFYLTSEGIVLCYGRYEVAPGAAGDPAFEIPYTWFEDIFIGE